MITTALERGAARRCARARLASTSSTDLASALRTLRALGVASLLVEGGRRVITSFFAEKLVDRLVLGIAPSIMGLASTPSAIWVSHLSRESVRLTNRSVHTAGDDLLVAADVV